jgi:hypothetical protein
MLTLILQGILLYSLSLAYWHLVRRFAVKTALDNIPGPPCPSFFKGAVSLVAQRTMPTNEIEYRKLSAVVFYSWLGVS